MTNAPYGIKHCPNCDEPIDDAQAYCSESCEQIVTLKDSIIELRDANRDLLKACKAADQSLEVFNHIYPEAKNARQALKIVRAAIAKAEPTLSTEQEPNR